jgi:transposase-like protein
VFGGNVPKSKQVSQLPSSLEEIAKLSPTAMEKIAKLISEAAQAKNHALQEASRRAEVKAIEPTNWAKVETRCPKCGHEGPVDPDFGVRMVRGIVRKQSYCARCRATTNYHTRPRKYGQRND